jgi:hypothetical protein
MKWNYYIGCHSACFQFMCLSLESEVTEVDANIHILLPSAITLLSLWDNATPPPPNSSDDEFGINYCLTFG